MPSENEKAIVEQGGMLAILCCCLSIGACGVAYVAFFVTGIVFLVQDRAVCSKPGQDSDLWVFCLVYLLSGAVVAILSLACPVDPIMDKCGQAVLRPDYDEEYFNPNGARLSEEFLRRNEINTRLREFLQVVVLILLFENGTELLIEPNAICDELKKTPLYVWFIIAYVAVCFGTFFCIAQIVQSFLLYMNQPVKPDVSRKSTTPETTPLTYQIIDEADIQETDKQV